MNRTLLRIALFSLLSFLFYGCGMDSIVLKPDYDFTRVKRVAVLEFKDSAYYTDSGSMVGELFVKYLLKNGFNVVEREELNAILREHQLSVDGILNRQHAKEFGKISGVDAIITGSIPVVRTERDIYEGGNVRYIAAQVGITCRMIDVETGEILWAGSDTYDAMNTQTAFEYLVSSIVRQFARDTRNTSSK